MTDFRNVALRIKEILQLSREPVAVKFLNQKGLSDLTEFYDSTTKTRYCQALMQVSQGKKVAITKENIACAASAAAFDLMPLTGKLASKARPFGGRKPRWYLPDWSRAGCTTSWQLVI